MQTRADYLLRMMQKYYSAMKIQQQPKKVKKKAPKVVKETSNGESSKMKKDEAKEKADGKKKKTKDGKVKEKKKDKKKRKNAPAMHYTSNAEPQVIDADLDPKIFALCKERMRPVKKALVQLGKCENLTESEKTEVVTQCLLKIGKRIAECLAQFKGDSQKAKEWRNHLWTFVSKFSDYSPKRAYKMYKSASKNNDDRRHKHKSHKHHHSDRDRSEDDSSNQMPGKRAKTSGGTPSKRIRDQPPDAVPYPVTAAARPGPAGPWPAYRQGRGDERDRFRPPTYAKPPTHVDRSRSYERPPSTYTPPAGPPNAYPYNSAYPGYGPNSTNHPYRDGTHWNRRTENVVNNRNYEGGDGSAFPPPNHGHGNTTNR